MSETMTFEPPAPSFPEPAPKKKMSLRKKILVGTGAFLLLGAIAGGSSGKSDRAAASSPQPAAAPAPAAASTPAPTAPPVTAKPAPPTTEKKAKSACKVVREALLTGTPAEIDAAMQGLIADTSAPSTAREYADYYLHRDGPGSFMSDDMREMDIGLIRMAC